MSFPLGVILPANLSSSELTVTIRPRHEVGNRNTWRTSLTGPRLSTPGPRAEKWGLYLYIDYIRTPIVCMHMHMYVWIFHPRICTYVVCIQVRVLYKCRMPLHEPSFSGD